MAQAQHVVDRGAAGYIARAVDAAGTKADATENTRHIFVAGAGAPRVAEAAAVDALTAEREYAQYRRINNNNNNNTNMPEKSSSKVKGLPCVGVNAQGVSLAANT
jgi:hypothetical protein